MGPWSRSFIAAVVGNAERPNLEVHNLRIEPGLITAEVEGCAVAITAPLIPARIWRTIERFAAGMGALEEAVEGKVQSVHLEHLLEEDWDETLIPRRGQITGTCNCDAGDRCEHIAAIVYAFADELERLPGVLLRWRGVTGAGEPRANLIVDPWRGRELRVGTAARRMPRHAVLKRLGSNGVPLAQNEDLAVAFRVAYDSLVLPRA